MRAIPWTTTLLLAAVARSAAAQAPADTAPPAASTALPAVQATPPPTIDAWLGSDKLRHFVLAGMVQGTTFGIATAVGARARPALVTASVVSATLSIGKEVVDRRRGGRFSARDLAWDAAGAALWGVLVARSGR